MRPCTLADGSPARPLVWSRRNGAWHRVPLLWVGAAPGNAGGLGAGELGAHGTRIPFGGDIAGANLDVLLASIATDRNHTFIVASLNQLPQRGGGEPTAAEIAAPVGNYADSVALLRDTVIAAGPALIVALGNVALRTLATALTRADQTPARETAALTRADETPARETAARRSGHRPRPDPVRMPGLARLAAAGLRRGAAVPWPEAHLPLAAGFRDAWHSAWREAPAFAVVQLLHPSAQNMSPFAGETTLFHHRMLITRDALRDAVRKTLGWQPPAVRPPIPTAGGIYDLPEWRERVAERHRRLDELWRSRGV